MAEWLKAHAGAPGAFFLTQGGATASPAVDAGTFPASSDIFAQRTTRTDYVFDSGTVDIGFHYRSRREPGPRGLWKVSPSGLGTGPNG